MIVSSIDHVVHVVPDIESAAANFERLGLTLSPRQEHAGMGTENRVFFTVSGAAEYYVELIGVRDRDAAARQRPEYVAKVDGGGGAALLSFAAADARAV